MLWKQTKEGKAEKECWQGVRGFETLNSVVRSCLPDVGGKFEMEPWSSLGKDRQRREPVQSEL